MNRFDPYENTSGPLDNYQDSLELNNDPLSNYSDPMTRVDPFADNPGLFNEIINWSHDPMNKPQNQNKYFFSDGKTYYEQICKMLKLMAVFKDAFNQIYDNEDEIHEAWENFVENLSATATAGDEASVTLVWTDESVQFEFVMPKGQKGDKGDQGDPGQDGVSISNITFNADYTMTITLSNGNTYTSPSLKGEKGDTGEGLEILDIYATLAELEQAHPTGQPGDAYLIGTDPNYTLYIWSTSQSDWLPAGSLTAPSPSTSTPLMDGTASTGSENAYSRGDHVHPTDTSRASASDLTALSGTVTNLGTTVGTISGNVTQLQTDMSQAQGNITQLQSDMSSAEGDISQLQTDVTGISGDVTQLQSDVSALEGQVDTLSDDLTDLEEIVTGSNDLNDQQFLYREAPTDHNTIARINSIKGNTVSFNQLVQNGNFANGTANWSCYRGTQSASNNEYTYTITELGTFQGANRTMGYMDYYSTHKYYVKCSMYVPKLVTGRIAFIYNNGSVAGGLEKTCTANSYTDFATVFTPTVNKTGTGGLWISLNLNNTSYEIGDIYKLKNVQVFDLTLMGIDNLSTAEEVEQWLSTHIANLPYYDYTLGKLIPFNGSGLKTVGKNLVFSTINGCSINSVGQIITDANFNMQIAQIIKDETYIIKSDEVNGRVCGFFYDVPTLNSVSYNNSRTINNNMIFVAPISGYIAFRSSSTYSTPQCEFGSTATAYEPYISNTLSLPTQTYFPFGDDGINNVRDELIPNSDVYKRNGLISDASKLAWTLTTNNIFRVSIPNKKVTGGRNYVICSKYPTSGSELKTDKTIWGEYATTNTDICIKDTSYSTASDFIASLSDVQIAYALETPLHNYGVVDLGSLNWQTNGTATSGKPRMLSSDLASIIKKPANDNTAFNGICAKYISVSNNATYNNTRGIGVSASSGNLFIYDETYTDATAFKNAMSGVYLLYELNTPVAPTVGDLTYPIWKDGTEQILPVNGSTPTTAPIKADFSYMSTDEAIQYLYDHISASVQAELDDLDDRVTDAETDISTMQTDISGLQTDLSTLYVIQEHDYGFGNVNPGQNLPYSGASQSVTGYTAVGIVGSKIYRMVDGTSYYANGMVLDYAFIQPNTYFVVFNIMNVTSATIENVRMTLYVLYIKETGGN